MEISASDLNYLLFVIPGFMVIWSYRHFTRAEKMGEFEYAAWSLIWGIFFMMATYTWGNFIGRPFPNIALDNLGGLNGVIAALTPLAVLIGYVGAVLYHRFYLSKIHKLLLSWVGKKD